MHELVKIVKKDDGTQIVDARHLHEVLEVGKHFRSWIKERIDEFGFEDGEDFEISKTLIVKVPEIGQSDNQDVIELENGTPYKLDYFVTLDMAKELAMVERNEMGRKVRKYFIAMEKLAMEAILAYQVPTVVINNVDYMPYEAWLVANGYSAMNGRRRIHKHPEFFAKIGKVYYISQYYATAMLGHREYLINSGKL